MEKGDGFALRSNITLLDVYGSAINKGREVEAEMCFLQLQIPSKTTQWK